MTLSPASKLHSCIDKIDDLKDQIDLMALELSGLEVEHAGRASKRSCLTPTARRAQIVDLYRRIDKAQDAILCYERQITSIQAGQENENKEGAESNPTHDVESKDGHQL